MSGAARPAGQEPFLCSAVGATELGDVCWPGSWPHRTKSETFFSLGKQRSAEIYLEGLPGRKSNKPLLKNYLGELMM